MEEYMEKFMEKSTEYYSIAAKALEDKFGEDIQILNIGKVSVLADYFIIATGKNHNQLQAMADEVEEKLYKEGLRLRHKEGRNDSGWTLLDFGEIIVHLFDQENRSFYNLERIWSDAEKVERM